jgi:hypothetical protein
MHVSIPTLVAIAIGAGLAISGNLLAYVMIGQINQRSAENERLSYWGWDLRIRKKHRQLYPESRLVYLFDLCVILMVACFPFLLWSMGVFSGK